MILKTGLFDPHPYCVFLVCVKHNKKRKLRKILNYYSDKQKSQKKPKYKMLK